MNNELDAEQARAKKQEDYKLVYDLGNTPVEGAFSVLFNGEGPFIKITAGADYFPFVGLVFGANTKHFKAGGFVFDHFWDRTYRIKGTLCEETLSAGFTYRFFLPKKEKVIRQSKKA